MIKENNKYTWCENAVRGMSGNNDGSTKMDCMIKHNYGNSLNLGIDSIFENFNNPEHKNFYYQCKKVYDQYNI